MRLRLVPKSQPEAEAYQDLGQEARHICRQALGHELVLERLQGEKRLCTPPTSIRASLAAAGAEPRHCTPDGLAPGQQHPTPAIDPRATEKRRQPGSARS